MSKMLPDDSPCTSKKILLPLISNFVPLFMFLPQIPQNSSFNYLSCRVFLLWVAASAIIDLVILHARPISKWLPAHKGEVSLILSSLHVSSLVTRAALWHCHRTFWWHCLHLFACFPTSVCGRTANPEKPNVFFWGSFPAAQTWRHSGHRASCWMTSKSCRRSQCLRDCLQGPCPILRHCWFT
jgi:hypothetical protein